MDLYIFQSEIIIQQKNILLNIKKPFKTIEDLTKNVPKVFLFNILQNNTIYIKLYALIGSN